jgi:hypothetical protein
MDLRWDETELRRGVYDWTKWDALMRDLRSHRLGAILILDYSNSLYAPLVAGAGFSAGKQVAESPRSREAVDAYARWARAAVRHFGVRNIMWEIYNEPNNDMFWRPAPDAQAYGALVQSVCRALDEADLRPTLVAGATAYIDFRFIARFLKSPGLDCVSGISVHPYPKQDPELTQFQIERLRAAVAEEADRAFPIYATESGYTTYRYGVSDAEQADFLARTYLVNLLSGLKSTIVYDWKDDGADPVVREDHFGLFNFDGSPKESAGVMHALLGQLEGVQTVQRLPMDDPADYAVIARGTGWSKLFLWTQRNNHAARVGLPPAFGNGVKAFVLGGAPVGATQANRVLRIDLSSRPVVVISNQTVKPTRSQ